MAKSTASTAMTIMIVRNRKRTGGIGIPSERYQPTAVASRIVTTGHRPGIRQAKPGRNPVVFRRSCEYDKKALSPGFPGDRAFVTWVRRPPSAPPRTSYCKRESNSIASLESWFLGSLGRARTWDSRRRGYSNRALIRSSSSSGPPAQRRIPARSIRNRRGRVVIPGPSAQSPRVRSSSGT